MRAPRSPPPGRSGTASPWTGSSRPPSRATEPAPAAPTGPGPGSPSPRTPAARTPSTRCCAKPSPPSAASDCCAPPTPTRPQQLRHHRRHWSSPRPTPTAMRALRTRFTKEHLDRRTDLMPRPYAAKGTVADDFTDAQRATWTRLRPHRRPRRRLHRLRLRRRPHRRRDPQPAEEAMRTAPPPPSPRPASATRRRASPTASKRHLPQDRRLGRGERRHDPHPPGPRGSSSCCLAAVALALAARHQPRTPTGIRDQQWGPGRHAHAGGLADRPRARASPSPSWTPASTPTTPTSSATSSTARTSSASAPSRGDARLGPARHRHGRHHRRSRPRVRQRGRRPRHRPRGEDPARSA